jgi:hypothetical protein
MSTYLASPLHLNGIYQFNVSAHLITAIKMRLLSPFLFAGMCCTWAVAAALGLYVQPAG